MGYRARWNSSDQIPQRAVSEGIVSRFGALDPSDGGDSYRYGGSLEWQRTRNNTVTRVSAYGIGYDLNLFSHFTFFLNDAEHGDQFHQADHRFVSGAGTTEAGRPSRRYGIELANYYSPVRHVTLDGDVSWSRARFTDLDPAGSAIPGSVQTAIAAGAAVDDIRRLSGSIRLRYFGPRPLIEDQSVRSKPTTLLNLDAGYSVSRQLRLSFDVFNVLDSRASDIDYFYASRLKDEPVDGVEDVHLHPALPRTARLTLSVAF